ncbi:MAG: galactokinase [Oscillospiraceae bacterium]|nr:galactokinase [Oscillospiraceae bacterium]
MTRFFCPGRTELAGNHTDHQKGRVMAAAVDKGITAEAELNGENVIRVFSQGFEPVQVDLSRLWPEESDAGTSASLVRGMAAVLSETVTALRGFDAYLVSDLTPGGGLSSSAAYSVLLGCIIAHFADGPDVSGEELARAAQKAENRFFGKPCGLMDQMACAVGGSIYMDLLENKLLHIDCGFERLGLTLCLTETGGSHAKATEAYASIPADMSAVAQVFGEAFLAKVRTADFDAQWPSHTDDPKWMRARHFFDENWRVSAMADALGLRDGQRYIELMNESGRSSEQLLRNIESPLAGPELARGLALSALLLEGKGAWRVHGGGFAGCVQALMPQEEFPAYQAAMDAAFGEGSCQRIRIRSKGVGVLEDDSSPASP